MNPLNRIAELYHESFLTNPKPQEYLSGLRITKPEIYQAFQIGYADGKIFEMLPNEGGILDELKKLGILTREGKEYLADCITFPLYDVNGNVTGIYGRKKDASGKAKHLYLPGKRGIFNRQAATSSADIIITGSIMDAIYLYQNGFPNAIPTYGNGLTEDHLQLFQDYRPKKLHLCFNGTEAEEVNKTLNQLGLKTHIIQLPDNQNLYNFFKSGQDFSVILSQSNAADNNPPGYSVTETEIGLVVTCQDREYRIRGISLHLDRLKVNIRATLNGKYHIDTLDLYQSRSRRYLISQLVRLFEVEPELIDSDLLYIISQIETYHAKQKEGADQKTYELTKQEEEEAVSFKIPRPA